MYIFIQFSTQMPIARLNFKECRFGSFCVPKGDLHFSGDLAPEGGKSYRSERWSDIGTVELDESSVVKPIEIIKNSNK